MGCEAVAGGFVMRAPRPDLVLDAWARAQMAVLGAEAVTESGRAPAA
jgi:hypothetical protein